MVTVSVIIPAYNVGPYIAPTLDSLFAQTRENFEAIVINDGSTDDTELRLAPYLDRIVYLKQKNRGVMAARNAGIRLARGRYIALLDGDDLWLPDFLEKLVGMLEDDPDLSVAYPNAWFYGFPGLDGRLYQDLFPVSEPVTFDRVLRRECYIFGSLVLRKSALDEVGSFDESLEGQGAEDFDLWLRMLQRGHRFAFTSEPLVRYRWRQNSLSNAGTRMLDCLISVYQKYLREESTTGSQRMWIESQMPELRARLNLARFRDSVRTGEYQRAAIELSEANRHYRRLKLKLMQSALSLAPSLVRRWVDR